MWQAGYFNDIGRDFHATFDRHLDDLLPAFAPGSRRRSSPAGRRALRLAHAIIESHVNGVRVTTPLD